MQMTDSKLGIYQNGEQVWVPGRVVDNRREILRAEVVKARYLPDADSRNQRNLDGYDVRILETDAQRFFDASSVRDCTNFARLAEAFASD